jgi:peptide/nickel transport system permease protein
LLPFLLRRLVNSIPTVIGATILIFFIIQLAPGDFLTSQLLNPNISKEQIDNLRRNFGLDQSLPVQYLYWVRNLLQGDLGMSFAYQQPVMNIVAPRVLNSLYLVLFSTVIFYLIAIPLGVYGAVRQYSVGDKITSTLMYFLLGFPSFFLALIVIYFILQIRFATGWDIPVGGMTSQNYDDLSSFGKFLDVLKHIAIPAIVLAIGDVAGTTRVLRGQMLENLNADYIRTARAKGVSEFKVVYKHTFRNAIIPFVAGIGGLLPALISGAGFTEVVFSYPGITPMLLESLSSQDLYVIAGFSLVGIVLLIIGNAISDILLSVVDPRIRYA